MSAPSYTYLALGDSYTIGEGVPAADNFPSQTVRLLRAAGIPCSEPTIVAKTGWTTGELKEGILTRFPVSTQPIPPGARPPSPALPGITPDPVFDFVSLLIGVNNEYRGHSLEEYVVEFEELLLRAIGFAGGLTAHVFVLSIPDWSITPFAHAHLPDKLGRGKAMVSDEIDAFNTAARRIADRHRVDFIDITPHTRESGNSWLTTDLLHPSGREYGYWAGLLSAAIAGRCRQPTASGGQ
ncbi:MAG TPA: GDSL-type esterase/lipase family protein [Puia sp.]|nr:GDSL-type esterase/lipase family protein [Puia sp.]